MKLSSNLLAALDRRDGMHMPSLRSAISVKIFAIHVLQTTIEGEKRRRRGRICPIFKATYAREQRRAIGGGRKEEGDTREIRQPHHDGLLVHCFCGS